MLHETQGQRTAVNAGVCAVFRESCAPSSHRATSDLLAAGMALPLTPKAGHLVVHSILVPQRQRSLAANGLNGSPPHRLSIHEKVGRARVGVLFCAPWDSQLPQTSHPMRGLGWDFVSLGGSIAATWCWNKATVSITASINAP